MVLHDCSEDGADFYDRALCADFGNRAKTINYASISLGIVTGFNRKSELDNVQLIIQANTSERECNEDNHNVE